MSAYPTDAPVMQFYNPPSYPPYPVLLGPVRLPESVAYWHSIPIQQPRIAPMGGPVSLQKQSAHGVTEQKKHKRTRSGCFTCRSRRVKCDEARPVCERCRKGKRDCVYPSPSAKSGSRTHFKSRDHHRQSALDNGSSDENDAGDVGGLEAIPDDEESPEPVTSPSSKTRPAVPRKQSAQSLSKRKARRASDASVASKSKSESPTLESAPKSHSQSPPVDFHSGSLSQEPRRNISALSEFTRLRQDVRFFLLHHQEKLNYHHYFLRTESDDFVRGTIIDLALKYEPLLYAVVGFSAYHHSLHQPDGKLYDFLKYYNRSLSLLRKSLGSGEQHGEAMLVTMLQLATFEECIGDWVNLLDHHYAAHILIRELLTPQSILTNELHRHIFIWYARFDVVAGILAGNETILSREWYTAIADYDAEQAALDPYHVQKQLALVESRIRLFALDMASLYAKLSRGMITIDQFIAQNDQLSQALEDMHRILQPFDTCQHAVKSSLYVQPSGPDDVLDPDSPGLFYKGPLWSVNFVWVDVLATELMFKYQSHLVIQRPEGSELQRLALEVCRFVETIMRWPGKEVGKVIAFQNCLPITGMFLPRDEKHIMWSRRMLALLETNGYIYPPKLRAGVAEIWQIPEVNNWWLPDDDCPYIVKEIRTLTEERTNNPRDNFREDIRDMKTLFWKMSLDDTGSQNSSPSQDSGSGLLSEPSPDQLSSSQTWQCQQQNVKLSEGDPPTLEPEGAR
ncbi:hypothetical protein VTN77DRAFT_1803 [Rasamsonia byssochlamydoides]|uniref:uncharacterized protein n=1 Tax=Rasamsonia byssochlamydoides TaxID=89139 RepID=UPI0037425AF8